MTESQISILFLTSRTHNLNTAITALDLFAPQTQQELQSNLRKFVEITRTYFSYLGEHIFDIITHYKQIFTARPSISILHSYITFQIHKFVHTLEAGVLLVEGWTNIFSVLNQCMYFGMSFGRIGLDFRHLIANVFEEIFELKLCTSLNDAFEVYKSKSVTLEKLKTRVDANVESCLVLCNFCFT